MRALFPLGGMSGIHIVDFGYKLSLVNGNLAGQDHSVRT